MIDREKRNSGSQGFKAGQNDLSDFYSAERRYKTLVFGSFDHSSLEYGDNKIFGKDSDRVFRKFQALSIELLSAEQILTIRGFVLQLIVKCSRRIRAFSAALNSSGTSF